MSDEPKIVISRDEFFTPAVNEALELQRAAEQSSRAPVEAPPPKFRLIYVAWFYLAVAGGLGAFLSWAALESKISDGLRFTGAIDSINPTAGLSGFTLSGAQVQGSLSIGGVTVFLVPGETRIQAAGSHASLDAEQLRVGSVVTVQGGRLGESSLMIAEGVRVEPPGAKGATTVNLESLASERMIVAILIFPLVAGMVGLFVGAVEGVVCRNWDRAIWSAVIGLAIGAGGGLISHFAANFAYRMIGALSPSGGMMHSAAGFLFQMFRRGLAWTIAGMTMGLGQGFALKSDKLKFNGFIGGLVGGLLGGLLFDPIDLLFTTRDAIPSAALSRALGFLVIGAAVGLMIGLTDLLTRDAWLKILSGPLQGKEFSFSRMPVRLGASPKNEVYLFKDARIDPFHAEIRKLRDAYELVDCGSSSGTFVDGQRIERKRLLDGARIRLGDSELSYFSRERKA